jgi:hypothetical protein
MNTLIDIFHSLNDPTDVDNFNCTRHPILRNVFLAKNKDGLFYTFILNNKKSKQSNDIVLTNVEYRHKRKCVITVENNHITDVFSYLKLTTTDYDLCNIYCILLDGILKDSYAKVSPDWLIDQFVLFAQLFEKLNGPSRNSISGLWGELFFINISETVSDSVRAWHQSKFANTDFSFKENQFEIKTSESDNRKHEVSAKQLNVETSEHFYIVSILVEEKSSGYSILDLMNIIIDDLADIDLKNKLRNQVIETIGLKFELVNTIRYDFIKAKDSIRFYDRNDIPTIENRNIPSEITNLRFLLDFTNLKFSSLGKIKCR